MSMLAHESIACQVESDRNIPVVWKLPTAPATVFGLTQMAHPTAVPLIPDVPRTLCLPDACRIRKSMLDLPHMAPLKAYAAALRRPGTEVPDFDPLDGGVAARLLFLLEKPGPMTAEHGKRAGSGLCES